MTVFAAVLPQAVIIPYQELLGNYDLGTPDTWTEPIIPYQELLGNYDPHTLHQPLHSIIPYQELLGNYDFLCC